MPFISNTDEQRKQMLQEIGVDSFEELLNGIPKDLFIKGKLNLLNPMSEMEIAKHITNLSEKNINTNQMVSFLGAGIYDHFVPAAVNYIIGRPEFYSAYTPYQAEVSQGTLQFIYEFQTMICELTGMECANASMYDGATAAAEAILMAIRHTRCKKILISSLIHPSYKEVIKTYTSSLEVELVYIQQKDGKINIQELKSQMDDSISAVFIQTPNFLGCIEDMKSIETIVHSYKNCLLIASVDPISLMLFHAPSEYNADIVIGEGQVLGNMQNFGGPLFGFFAAKKNLIRKMPGRIVGATHDKDDRRGYVLTLQAREQHIRRNKATSNICTNESLCALAATVYMVLMGKKGLREVATQSTIKAHYLFEEICKLDGFSPAYSSAFFKEFAVKTEEEPKNIIEEMKKKGFFAGVDITPFGYENQILMAVTEKRTKEEMDNLIKALTTEVHPCPPRLGRRASQ
ncbi:MAG: aminomethyl-transferring glycine dehydrogenase subunit GcvPA [Candidatus Cloacimonadota bacterium]|nr:aminomethyl-transferring glycine dehydrogenase subunit GcvPA [Candidatus Cloacimonadota bacterium]